MHTVQPTSDQPSAPAEPPRGTRRRRHPALPFAVGGLALAALGSAIAVAVAGGETGDRQGIEITADDTGMSVATTSVGPGYTEFEMTNDADNEHALAIVRLHEGVARDDVPDLLMDPDFSAVANSVDFFGGVNAVAPGDTFTMTVGLLPGQYAIVDYGEGPEGPWFLQDGFVQSLTVTEGDAAGDAPNADVQITEIDFRFELPARIPRESIWEITNDGEQGHEIDLVQLDPGVTPDEAIDLILNSDGESIPGEEINILGGLSAGRTAYVDVTLEPGQYLAVCFWPDTEHDGVPHIVEGMSAAFAVE